VQVCAPGGVGVEPVDGHGAVCTVPAEIALRVTVDGEAPDEARS